MPTLMYMAVAECLQSSDELTKKFRVLSGMTQLNGRIFAALPNRILLIKHSGGKERYIDIVIHGCGISINFYLDRSGYTTMKSHHYLLADINWDKLPDQLLQLAQSHYEA